MAPNVNLLQLKGTHHEIGLKQGQAIRADISKFLREMPNIRAFTMMKPKLIPTSLYLYLGKRRATKLLLNDITQHQPKQMERLRGISEGAELNIPTTLFLQSLELLIGTPTYTTQACTTLAFTQARTKSKEVIVAKNFDYLNDLSPYQLLIESNPEGRYRTLSSTVGPLPGTLDGMNEHGLTVTYNLIFSTDKPTNYVPLSMVLQEMLETCRSTEEAVRYVTESKRGGHEAVLTIADPSGDVRAVELTSNHSATRRITSGQMINANKCQTDEMRRFEVPHNAVYSGSGSPEEWRGMRVHESSEMRQSRAEELLRVEGGVDEEKIKSILRDHRGGDPSNLTICMHGSLFSTVRSVIFYPERRSLKILHGNPCKNEYSEFSFSPPNS